MGISATIWALWYSSRLESQRRADDVGDEEDAKMYVRSGVRGTDTKGPKEPINMGYFPGSWLDR